jgi:predicted metal-dependent hydrolase
VHQPLGLSLDPERSLRYPDRAMDPERKRQAFRHAIDCFNRRRFFTCHEVLEEIWLEEPPEEKPFYQGIIQVAAAFHHCHNGNLKGTRSLMQAGAEKLHRYPPDSHGLDLASLLAQLGPWLLRLHNNEPLDDLPLPTIRLLHSV